MAIKPTNTIKMLQTVVRTGRLMKLSESDISDQSSVRSRRANLHGQTRAQERSITHHDALTLLQA